LLLCLLRLLLPIRLLVKRHPELGHRDSRLRRLLLLLLLLLLLRLLYLCLCLRLCLCLGLGLGLCLGLCLCLCLCLCRRHRLRLQWLQWLRWLRRCRGAPLVFSTPPFIPVFPAVVPPPVAAPSP